MVNGSMPQASIFARIEMVYLAAILNAVAVGMLLVSSDALSNKISSVHQAFVGSIGWFAIGLLFSGATIILHLAAGRYRGAGRESDLVRTAAPVASIMSLFLFILGVWESAPLIRHLGF